MIWGFVIEQWIAKSKFSFSLNQGYAVYPIGTDMIETTKTRISPTPVYANDQVQVQVQTKITVPAESDADGTEVVIRPRSGWIAIDWKEMMCAPRIIGFLDLA